MYSPRLLSRGVGVSAILILLLVISSCGSGGVTSTNPTPTPTPGGNTQIALQLSTRGNDQLTEFYLTIQELALISKQGTRVVLIDNSSNSLYYGGEFMHLNSGFQPMLTATVPQDYYVSAEMTIGGAEFTCNTLAPDGNLLWAGFAYGQTPKSVVNLPSTIAVESNAMGLNLEFQMAQSYTLESCYWGPDQVGFDPYTITPTFNLTSFALDSVSTEAPQAVATDVGGMITAVNSQGGSFTLSPFNGAAISAATSGSTKYQQVTGFSALAVGMFVNVDLATQPDGSQLATRIAVPDSDTTTLSVARGPILQTTESGPYPGMLMREGAGYLSQKYQMPSFFSLNAANTTFAIAGNLSNLQVLPFTPLFNATNLVPGQDVLMTTHSTEPAEPVGSPVAFPATTITLVPQTIDGTVAAIAGSGGFDVYTVTLASYNLFPTFAVQQGQASLLASPGTVMVYVDSNVQKLNSTPIGVGSVLRFHGLIFNDNGTLRMDAAQISDGVAQ